jgi:hypothetical protein
MHVRHVSGRGARAADAVGPSSPSGATPGVVRSGLPAQQARLGKLADGAAGDDADDWARADGHGLSTSPTPTRGWSAHGGDTWGWADGPATGSAPEAEFSLPREVLQTLALLVASVALTAVLATLAHVAVGLFG